MRKVILKTKFAVGDVVMMTAAVRDLHRCCPQQFLTDVRTNYPEIWENNPYLTYLEEKSSEVDVIDCRYPLIDHADYRPYHCLHGYIQFLNEKLGVQAVPTEFKGDIHLSSQEKEWASQIHELAGRDIPFWIVAAGGKHDISIKWWSTERYQQVVDHFRGRIAFVQIGEVGHHHPKLQNTIDLRGQTSLRELIRLVYHSQGCLCSVTALMHLAAAVETKPNYPSNRPCVVVAGGREPPNWEAYPHHQFLHTVGMLSCCSQGGCWRARTAPLGDGNERDKPDALCLKTIDGLPACMHMITPDEVIRKIEDYLTGGAIRPLFKEEAVCARKALQASKANTYDLHSLSEYNAASVMDEAIRTLPAYPGGFVGRGIVVCGGGLRYFPCAWVCINMLRKVGCGLPIQFWYQGKEEMDSVMVRLLTDLGVQCIDATELEKQFPRRVVGGWELKSYALLHSRFREILLLDADNVPVQDPTFLFDSPEYRRTGSVFWPDYGFMGPERRIWSICGLDYRQEPEFETGQLVVNKEQCWRPLALTFWLNDHSDFFFRHIHGDKETFHLAWRKLGHVYTMIPTPIKALDGIMCQHDLEGRRLFQHRNTHKWKAFGSNRRVKGFRSEKSCLAFLRELEEKWDGNIHVELANAIQVNDFVFRGGTFDRGIFHDVFEKNEYDLPERFSAKSVIIDVGAHIGTFSYTCLKRGARRVIAFEPDHENCRLARHNLLQFGKSVRIYEKAVWRSDRHSVMLLHSGYSQTEDSINTGGGSLLLEGEATPDRKRKEFVSTIALDRILRSFKSVSLLKLDCEGSEWPILFTSRLLAKVESICGEFHEIDRIPPAARVGNCSRYSKNELEDFLRSRYKVVRIQAHVTDRLGHFWAEQPIRGNRDPSAMDLSVNASGKLTEAKEARRP